MGDTIFALSSGALPSGVAVVRISGPRAFAALRALGVADVPAPRVATLLTLFDPDEAQPIDRALALCFPAPGSFTGEDVAELHLHGGRAVVARLLDVLGTVPGLRPAEPGAFTRRAFDNGKLDLTQAEGLGDLIAADTEAQRRQALALAGGRLRAQVAGWREQLTLLRANAEALIDFAEDEADVAQRLRDDGAALAALQAELAAALATATVGERVRDGLAIAVAGPPNAGKSSLVNSIAGRDVAIVTDRPGTTRDLIELPLDLGGVPATLIDTAGLRTTSDPVEAEGIRRARARAATADLVLLLRGPDDSGEAVAIEAPSLLQVRTKADLDPAGRVGWHGDRLHLSAASGAGIDTLLEHLRAWALAATRSEVPVLVTQRRHVAALTEALGLLDEADAEPDPVLRAESLRLASRSLDALVGTIGVEQLLDSIFGRFCIGK